MTSKQHNADLRELVDEYRLIKAPVGIAEKVQARLNDQNSTARWWVPVAAGFVTATAVILLVLLPLNSAQQSRPLLRISGLPNLSSISSIKIKTPARVSVSLVRLRTLSLPVMPEAPGKMSKPKPNSSTRRDAIILPKKESNHAYI